MQAQENTQFRADESHLASVVKDDFSPGGVWALGSEGEVPGDPGDVPGDGETLADGFKRGAGHLRRLSFQH